MRTRASTERGFTWIRKHSLFRMKGTQAAFPVFGASVGVGNGNNPDGFLPQDVCDVVRKSTKVYPPVAFGPQARHFRISGNPLNRILNFAPQLVSEPRLLRLVKSNGFKELALCLIERDSRHFPRDRSTSRSTSAKGRPLAIPESTSRIRRSISSSHASSAPRSASP